MALLKPINKPQKRYVRISLQTSVLEEIKLYCQWAKIQKLDDFFELAAQHIFKKDRDWKNHNIDDDTARNKRNNFVKMIKTLLLILFIAAIILGIIGLIIDSSQTSSSTLSPSD